MKYRTLENPELKFRYVIYPNGKVFNLDKGREIKPYKDKRRPNECPAIYLAKKDGTRTFQYHDRLVASLFCKKYTDDSFIYHIDGNIENCSIDNLLVRNGIDILRDIYHDEKEWKRVEIPESSLYYEYYICEDGRLFNATTGVYVLPFEDKRLSNYGNLRYNLYYGKSINEIMHYSASRLVALHFIPIHPKNKELVLFKDRNHENLHYSNLFWGDSWDALNQDIPDAESSREFTCLKNGVIGKEKWRILTLPGVELEHVYKVSNMGRVYNVDKQFYCSQFNVSAVNINNQSYKQVGLKITNDGYKSFSVHRLVAFMFCENDDWEHKIHVNHINGNPECNWAINLEWCTPMENLHHAFETNLLHNDKYIGNVSDIHWRLNTILSWIYSKKNVTHEYAYKFYNDYKETYNDNIPNLSFSEFVNTYLDKLENDNDFKNLLDFYKAYK